MSTWRTLLRNRASVIGLSILGILGFASVVGPMFSPHDPYKQNLRQAMLGPSLEHPFGTDSFGRDLFTRVLLGGRVSLIIGVGAVLIGLVIGGGIGLLSGYAGGWIDQVLQRITDAMFAFSSLLLALALVAILGPGVFNVVIAVGVGVIPVFIRLSRSQALVIRQEPYVAAAQLAGLSSTRIIGRHVMRNAMTPLIVQASIVLGTAILGAASLGFLGLGVQEPTAEWGAMLGQGRQFIFADARMLFFPGVAISLAVISFNLIGDGLRDALDPRTQGSHG